MSSPRRGITVKSFIPNAPSISSLYKPAALITWCAEISPLVVCKVLCAPMVTPVTAVLKRISAPVSFACVAKATIGVHGSIIHSPGT